MLEIKVIIVTQQSLHTGWKIPITPNKWGIICELPQIYKELSKKSENRV